MRENSRVRRQRSGLALGATRAVALLAVALAMLGGAFLLGVSVGHQAAAVVPATPVATRAALDHLDDLPAMRDEAAPVLKAPQVLTDTRPIEKAMPLAPAKLVPPAIATSSPPPPSASASTSTHKNATAAAAGRLPGGASPSPRDGEEGAEERGSPTGSPPDHRGAFAIQVASSASRADAERFAARLAGKAPRVVAAEVPGKGRWYRVQLGSYPTQELARKALPELARAGLRGLVVTASR